MPKLSTIWVLGLFIYPFFFWTGVPFPYIYPKLFLLTAWVGLGLIAFSIKTEKDEVVSLGKIELSYWGLLIVSALSMFYSPDIPVALFGPFWRGTGIIFYLVILLILLLLKEKRASHDLVARLTLITGILVSFILLTIIAFSNLEEAKKAMMGNPNALSMWLGLTILLNFQYSKFYSKLPRPVYYGSYIPLFAALILMGSRSAVGGVVLSFFLIGLMTQKRVLKFASLTTVGLVAAMAAEYYLSSKSVIAAMIHRSSSFARLGIFKGAWDSFLAEPLFGYSTQGLIQGYWYNYTSWLGLGIEWNDNAHNIILNIIAEIGIPGLVLFLFSCFFIYKVIKEKEGRDRACWTGVLLYLTIYALLQPFYVDSTFLVILFLYLMDESPKFEFSATNKFYRGGKIVIGIGLVYLAGMQAHQLDTINQTRHEIVKFRKFRKVWNDVAKQVPHLDVAGSMLEINNQIKPLFTSQYNKIKHVRKPLASFMVDSYKNMIEDYSHRPRLLENYAVWLSRRGYLRESIQYLDKVIEGSDQVTRAYMAKATIYMHMKDYATAKKLLLKVKELNPNYRNLEASLRRVKNY